MNLIIFLIVIFLLFGANFSGSRFGYIQPHYTNYGYGGLGTILIIVIVLFVLGFI